MCDHVQVQMCGNSNLSHIYMLRPIHKIANLISKLNFYKLIPYPMDNCFTGWRDRSRQTSEKDVLYIIPAVPVTECAFARWRIVLPLLSRQCDIIASFLCLILLRPLVS